jgi:hypothetical protein
MMQLTMATTIIWGKESMVPVKGSHHGPDNETVITTNKQSRLAFLIRAAFGGKVAFSCTERLAFWRRHNAKNAIIQTMAASGKIIPHMPERPRGW